MKERKKQQLYIWRTWEFDEEGILTDRKRRNLIKFHTKGFEWRKLQNVFLTEPRGSAKQIILPANI